MGCSTVRPPTDDTLTATVIARVLAAHRGQHGFVETERYLLPGESIPWIDLRLSRP